MVKNILKSILSILALVVLLCVLIYLIVMNTVLKDKKSGPQEVYTPVETESIDNSVDSEEVIPVEITPPVEETPVSEEPVDLPKYENIPDIDINDWMYRLVNTDNPLEDDFTVALGSVQNGQYFDARAADALSELYLAARSQNIPIILNSGYRDIATQRQLYEWRLNTQLASGMTEEEAIRTTLQIVAYPGTSEHNLGLAIDILDKDYYTPVTTAFADTELGIWLKENCADFGFILRYPQDKTDITGISFEPWHFRYVGKEAARFIMDNGLCLEEFLDLYK